MVGPLDPAQSGTCTMAVPYAPLLPAGQPQFVYDLPVPVGYFPDTSTFQTSGTEYYEIRAAPVTHPPLAFPQPAHFRKKNWLASDLVVPAGNQWLGLVGAKGRPLFTPVWGYGPVDPTGGPLGATTTYPSMSFHARKGTPVKVKWVNDLPAQHLFCPSPQDSNVPCAIDRTLMGAKLNGLPVTAFGSDQSPDNAMVIHLHGGEIPPDADGFAELWIGNTTTSSAYRRGATATFTNKDGGSFGSNLDPTFEPPTGNAIPADLDYAKTNLDGFYPSSAVLEYQPGQLMRPTGNSIVYNYPMVQEPATIWYHDHALGKTRINVAAGPAGFFIIEDPAGDKGLGLPPRRRVSAAALAADQFAEYRACTAGDTYVNPATGAAAPYGPGNCFDIPVVFQDRSFNADGTINFPNGLGQIPLVVGANPLTPGPNPLDHPQWVPEYFGDFAVVNGVIWPRLKVEQRAYRFRMLDGSNARCYTFGLKSSAAGGVPPFVQIATDQGYLPRPVSMTSFSLCPGERAEVVIDFSRFKAGDIVTVTNSAAAPFPNGITPNGANSPFAMMAQLMQFQVVASAKAPWTPPATLVAANDTTVPNPPALGTNQGATRTMVLNEVLHPVTLAPLAVQIDGKPFEAPITETPQRGTREVWQIVNTTVDAHPMHLHLVKFRVLSRQKINVAAYGASIGLANPATMQTNADPTPYLMGAKRGPDANEIGWKDTAKSFPGEVLTIEAKWDGSWNEAPAMISDGAGGLVPDPAIPFYEPVTSGPYVWHCHIVDHEDNEMMRPVLVMP